MEKPDKVTDINEHDPSEPEEAELDNFQLNLIRNSPVIKAIMDAKDIPKKAKLKIYTFFFAVMDRPEVKALYKALDEIHAEYVKENPEQLEDGEKIGVRLDNPIFTEIYEQDSRVKIKKLYLTGEEIPDAVSVADMMGLAWLIKLGE